MMLKILLSFEHTMCLLRSQICICFVMFQDAVAKYEVVLQNLDFARDLHKQFQMMLLEVCRSLISSADDYNNSW